MKAAQIVAHRQPLLIGDVPDPTIGPNDAVVHVEAEGVCRSDWHTWNGDWGWFGALPPLPVIPGHEFAGVVTEVGAAVRRIKVGDRVTVPFNEGCGSCVACLGGRSNICHNVNFPGYTHNGGYGELVAVLNADFNCVLLPEAIDMVSASTLACRYMTMFNAVGSVGRLKPGEWVVVWGAGGMGLGAVQIAAASGGRVIAVDRKPDALALAERQGAAHLVNASTTDDVPAAIKELTGGGAHLSIEAAGGAETTVNSILSLRQGGRHVQAGVTSKIESGMITIPMDLVAVCEIEILGCLGMPHNRYDELLGLVAAGRLNPKALVTRELKIDEISGVMEELDDYRTTGMYVITSY